MIVSIRLLGDFRVTVDGQPVPTDAWARPQAATLVKLLALAPGRRLHREQVIEAMWPGTTPVAAGPRLHKTAHYARRALGADDAVALRSSMVLLWPDAEVEVDLDAFTGLGRSAVQARSAAAAERALQLRGGPLLPDEMYADWAEEARRAERALNVDLLRLTARWEQVLELEPSDEESHLALMQRCADRGDVRGALRQYERLQQALRHELGTTPSDQVEELHRKLAASVAVRAGSDQGVRLVGRRQIGDRIRRVMSGVEEGRGGIVLLSGPPGVGKTAVLGLVEALARAKDWRIGQGTAASVEGPWHYATILEACADLARRHPALLDGLDDQHRAEIQRAIAGRDDGWSGETGHQRLFVAVAELMRLGASGRSLLLTIDDLHEADEASLRLLHYLSRVAMSESMLIVGTCRSQAVDGARQAIIDDLVRRGSGATIEVTPLPEATIQRLLADRFPDLSEDDVRRVSVASAGLPYHAIELAGRVEPGSPGSTLSLPRPVAETFGRVAVLGQTFGTDDVLAVSGLSEDETYAQLETALAALVVEPVEGGYRFRHPLLREALVESIPPTSAARIRREVAERIAARGARPGRVADLYLAAGMPSRALPYVLRAVETAGALGAYRDGLRLIQAVVDHAGPADRARLLARRGDLLHAVGDPDAVAAYTEALPLTTGTEHRLVRARLAKAATIAGDLDTARSALAGLSAEGDAADGPILLSQGVVAMLSGDTETARAVVDLARNLQRPRDDTWQIMDVVTLQGMIAHESGEWFERFQVELRRTRGQQQLVTSLFDAHLCVAEYVLYGPVPYAEVIRESAELRRRAEQAGALRGVGFATALIGEAALLMGDLDRAERELTDAVELHREIDAPAGEAHSLQRLAEVYAATGRRADARELLRSALPLARWSIIARHLLPRIYGTMISVAPDPLTAAAVVDEAEATMRGSDLCNLCQVMLAVPAALASVHVGDLSGARRHLEQAEMFAERWPGTAWTAAALETKAHVAAAEGHETEAVAHLAEAAALFACSGQPLDAARCRDTMFPVPDVTR